MKPGGWLAGLLVVAVSATCVRLGFWQLHRLAEKRAINASQRAALASEPLDGRGLASAEAPRGRRVRLSGRFDPRYQILLRGRVRAGAPGVEVATPWRLAGDSAAVLVVRGWLASDDAVHVPRAGIPDDPASEVTGFARDFARPAAAAPPPLRDLESGEGRVWSAARLDPDTLAARLPYPIAHWWLAALPGPGAPPRPARDLPEPAPEAMHLGYAVQWFLLAALAPAGALILARRRAGPRP